MSEAEPRPGRVEGASRLRTGRRVAGIAKIGAASAAVAGLGVFALLARATHAGGSKHASRLPALSAPRSFVHALDTGFSPGSIGPASGPAQTVSGGS